MLIDPEHLLTELYAISNVPTVVWIDEDDHIVRPNSVAFSTDMFKEFTGDEAGPHLDALRAWVRDGTVSLSPADDAPRRRRRSVRRRDPSAAALPRRRRSAATRRRRTRHAGTSCARASSRPIDFTIRRAAMPLIGEDPFGEDFMALWQEWNDAGSPFHGLPSMTAPDGD